MTSRRSFLQKLALGVAGFAILPAATTYARTWKKTEAIWIPDHEFDWREFGGKWKFVDVPLVIAWHKGATFKEFGIT